MSDPRPSDPMPVVACNGLAKTYTNGPADVAVLNGIDLAVMPGEQS